MNFLKDLNNKEEPPDILLVICPPWAVDMPLLGVAYLATYLKSKRFKVEVLDLNIKLYNQHKDLEWLWVMEAQNFMEADESFNKLYESVKDTVEHYVHNILTKNTPIIGFSVNYRNRRFAIEMARLIKKKDKNRIIVFGGPDCYVEYYTPFFRSSEYVDIYVLGEGEETLTEIVKRVKENQPLKGISGTLTPSILHNKDFVSRPLIKDLDSIPYPTYSEFDLAEYRGRCLPLLTSRGCIYRCSYCIDHYLCGTYRNRSPKLCLEEIKYHIQRYGVREFSFNDLICNGNLKWLDEFCGLIINEGIKISWWSYAVIRPDMDLEILIKMRKAGAESICYGFENGSNAVLKRMNKFYTAQDAERVLRLSHQAQIKTYINIITGFPGETKEEFVETVEFLKRNKDYVFKVANLSPCFVMPGSDLAINPNKYGIAMESNGNWSDLAGNDDKVRKDRVRKLTELLLELNLGPILSNLKEDNINLRKTRLKKLMPSIISKDSLKVLFQNGKAKIIWKDKELTTGLCMYTSLRSQGHWYDSTQAKWEIKKIKKRNMAIIGKWFSLPINQRWKLKIKRNNTVYWKVYMFVDKELRLEREQANVMLSESYNQWFLNSDKQSCFPNDFNKDYGGDWDILAQDFANQSIIGVKNEHHQTTSPTVTMKATTMRNKYMVNVVNSDDQFNGRLLQCLKRYPEEGVVIKRGEKLYFKGIIKIIEEDE